MNETSSQYLCSRTRTVTAYVHRVATREKFSKWVCEQHNIVNEKIGKPKYSCDLPKLDERWKVGTAACKMAWDQGDKDTASGSLGQWDEED
eukprot:CAMPEP_0114233778 /NCGR_PEP_ID=MMETSP0058-20121206/5363_1 /TAXON_ID=36894 /ORGANISM="Pyramimonas parkeae, CCMP726" /LENGTH=90 /DNA_ID=CAMNT_0001345425 /DNA_START=1017 /DNA_END=1289 /DNA_ORIENTATION=-